MVAFDTCGGRISAWNLCIHLMLLKMVVIVLGGEHVLEGEGTWGHGTPGEGEGLIGVYSIGLF